MRRHTSGGLHQSVRHTYRLELQLDFDGPVSGTQAKEVARRLTEALRLVAGEGAGLGSLQRCQLLCHELRQILPLELPPA